MLDYEKLPGFRVAFDPSEITWDIEPSTIMQRANDVSEGARHPTVSERVHMVPLLWGFRCTEI